MTSILFTPGKIGPLTIRNRTIRSAAFESMCPGNAPSQELLDYHKSVAAGGVGMTTVAYAAVTQSGLSFDRQLWMRPEIVAGMQMITDAIHKEGAAASIQLGHCGNMSHRSICGQTPVGASTGFNLYSPTFVRGLRKDELPVMAKEYGKAVRLARECGFDAVEIHAGHGYLISQFLSPYTNHRHDEYGGSLENRMRFMDMVMEEVMKAAKDDMAVLVKMNMRDGFKGGMELDESETPERRRCTCFGIERRFRQQGTDVCHARSNAHQINDLLYELLVVEMGRQDGRTHDDSDRTVQGGLFSGRCLKGQSGSQRHPAGVCRRISVAGKNRRGSELRLPLRADGTCITEHPGFCQPHEDGRGLLLRLRT